MNSGNFPGWISGLLLCLAISTASGALRLQISGNDFFSEREIRSMLPSEPDPEIAGEADRTTIARWEDDAEYNIEARYEEIGFLDADPRIELTWRKSQEVWSAAIRIDEGSRYRVASVELALTDSTAPRLLPDPLALRRGEPFIRELLFQDERTLRRAYGDAGFLNADVTAETEIDEDLKSVRIRYLINPGHAAVFDTLVVKNMRLPPLDTLAGLTNEEYLRGIVGYARGDTITVSKNDDIVAKLQATRVFTFVSVTDSQTADGNRSRLVVTAVERTPGLIRSSLFYETEYGFGSRIMLEHANFNRRMDAATVSLMAAQQRQRLQFDYSSALTLGYLLGFDNETDIIWYQQSDLHEDLQTGPFRGDFEGHNFSRLSRAFYSWFRYTSGAEFFARSLSLAPERRSRGFNLNFTNTGLFSFVDRLVNPMKGARFTLTWGNGGPLIREEEFQWMEFRHNWLEGESAYYYPIATPLRIAGRLNGGLFFSEGGINSSRFFLGGPRSVRSFGSQELCPIRDGIATQGSIRFFCRQDNVEPAYYLASAEIHLSPWAYAWVPSPGWLRLVRPTELAVFTDYGKVWDRRLPFGEQEVGEGVAYGFGFRYPLFDIFNLRLDFAWGERGTGEEVFAWMLDLSQAF